MIKQIKNIFSLSWTSLAFWLFVISFTLAVLFVFDNSNSIEITDSKGVLRINELGDFLAGVLAPALSLIGVILVMATFRSQTKQTSEDRSRNTFYQMYNLHSTSINNLQMQNHSKGIECLKTVYSRFSTIYLNDRKSLKLSERDLIIHSMNKLNEEYHSYYTNQMEALIMIIKYVDEKFEGNDKNDVILTLKVGVSIYELLLFYYYLISIKDETAIKIVKDFSFFSNIKINELLDQKNNLKTDFSHKELYSINVFS